MWKYVDPRKQSKLSDLIQEQIELINKGKPYETKDGRIRYRKLQKEEIYIVIFHVLKGNLLFTTLTDTDEVLWYNETVGIWEKEGEVLIKRVARNFKPDLSRIAIGEIIDKIRTATYVRRELFDSQHLLALKNKVINLENFEVLEHSHLHYLTRKLPVIHDPEAGCPKTMIFFQEIVSEPQVLFEIIAYCLFPGYPIQKAFMMVGSGANGKSTYINLITGFLGTSNVSSVELQRISTDRFAVAGLYGKMANLCADLPNKALKSTGMFKALRGNDLITADIKNKNPFQFQNKAKMIFSCNEIPASHDDTDAFYRSWIIIEFPNQFTADKADKDLIKKISTEEELSGLLNEVLKHLNPLIERGSFIGETEDIERLKEEYILKSNNVKAFVHRECIEGSECWITKDNLYKRYKDFCGKYNSSPKANNTFTKELKNWSKNVTIGHRRISGEKVPVYFSIDWNTENETVFRVETAPINEKKDIPLNKYDFGSSGPGGPGFSLLPCTSDTSTLLNRDRKKPNPLDPPGPDRVPSEPKNVTRPNPTQTIPSLNSDLDVFSQILKYIQSYTRENGGSITHKQILVQFPDLDKETLDDVLVELMDEGQIYEPTPGVVKVID